MRNGAVPEIVIIEADGVGADALALDLGQTATTLVDVEVVVANLKGKGAVFLHMLKHQANTGRGGPADPS